MSEDQARRLKKIDFLKSVGSTPERKIEDIGRELGIGRTGSYKYLQEFIENAVMTDNEPDFPEKLLRFYNKNLLENEEQLVNADVEALRPWIDDYYQKHLPRHEETLNTEEQSNRTMSYPNQSEEQWRRFDRTTDTGLLRDLLTNAKIVHPSVIERFLNLYELNRENWTKNPLSMMEYMKHNFGNAQGEQIWKIFQESRGKFVYDPSGQAKPSMDPMMLWMMMQGGGFNPAMMGAMGGGAPSDPNLVMNAMIMGQMQKEAARKQEKEDSQAQMDKIMQMLMFKMVGSSIDDKKPMYDMMGMGGMMGPPTMREVLDEGGRVKARDYIPNFQGQHPPGNDPMSVMMMGKLMDANTALMMKATDSSKTPLEILTTMIPFFKDQGNAATQLAGIMDTVNKVAPGFFERRNEPQGGLEVYKLKFDTELAMQAQKIELAKMEHMWDVDKMDKQASAESAKNWMGMIETFGSKIVDTVGPAITNGFGKNLLGKGGAASEQPRYTPEQMQQIMRARQMQAAQAEQQEAQTQQGTPQGQISSTSTQSQPDMSTIYLLTNYQNALAEKDKQVQELVARLNQTQAAPQQNYNIPEATLQKMASGQLKEILQELGMQNQAENNLKQRIEATLANRALMDQQPTERQEQEETRADSPDERSFNTGNDEAEPASSEATKNEEESTASANEA